MPFSLFVSPRVTTQVSAADTNWPLADVTVKSSKHGGGFLGGLPHKGGEFLIAKAPVRTSLLQPRGPERWLHTRSASLFCGASLLLSVSACKPMAHTPNSGVMVNTGLDLTVAGSLLPVGSTTWYSHHFDTLADSGTANAWTDNSTLAE